MEKMLMCYTTFSTEQEAKSFARKAVEHQVAACANIFPQGYSIYSWEGGIEENGEWYVLLKTALFKKDELHDFIIQHHPYDTPAMIVWSADTTQPFAAYLAQAP